jgi:hypothetical protein
MRMALTLWLAAFGTGLLGQPIRADVAAIVQQPSIAGMVVEAGSARPLAGALVTVEGTQRRAVTDAQGRFQLDARSGETEVSLRVSMLGYRTQTRTVRVGAGIRLTLESEAIQLNQVVVTATGEQRLVEVGSSITRVRADSAVQVAPVTDFAELLNSREATNRLSTSMVFE